MPELPEVEITRRGLVPYLVGRCVETVLVRNRKLRWPIARNLRVHISGCIVRTVERRAKYLLIGCSTGWLIVHLGMSGSLRVLPRATPAGKHDHFDLVLDSGMIVRLTDPRRFGAVLWAARDPHAHPLLADLAPEPLGTEFDAAWLHARTRGRSAAIKTVLMDSHTVVGVGNIYATESLFRAGINPKTAAGKVSLERCDRLVYAIRETLSAAIDAGGSTLRDFVDSDGNPGYFQQNYYAYGRGGQPCRVCGKAIRVLRQGQRATFYCPQCQH
ncbi:MAG TPA: bifunctional DNA-formamidopyrimidine glycosylase/DNA-(apurinic or apyrimidinic site) lyase [Burkholderiales bacterium]|nr:bifunctional DNA-formamidopyrimidine glycosylase/DNA-(apurinic or apyrimidinic site) lyase [Burkholderiales bacterium]